VHRKLRQQGDVIERCRTLRAEVRAAVERLPGGSDDPAVVDAVWRGEALGTLPWALRLAELPPYDRPFVTGDIANRSTKGAALRDGDDLERELESARLWHWRARTTELQGQERIELPARYASFDQLIAAVAMRGHEDGVLPTPLRGDFQAYGKNYRHLSPDQHAEAHSIAAERHHALNWVCGLGESWDTVPLDT